MTRHFILVIFFAVVPGIGFAQNKKSDSLQHELAIARQDSDRVFINASLCDYFRAVNPDSSVAYGEQALALSHKIKFDRGISIAYNSLGYTYRVLGQLPRALSLQFKGLQICEENGWMPEAANCLNGIGNVYGDLNKHDEELFYLKRAKQIHDALPVGADKLGNRFNVEINIGISYQQKGQLDSALIYLQKVYDDRFHSMSREATILMYYGDLQFRLGNRQKAFDCLFESISIAERKGNKRIQTLDYILVATFFKALNQRDSCILYARKGLAIAQSMQYKNAILDASTLLANQFETTDPTQSVFYYKLAIAEKDSLFGAGNILATQTVIAGEKDRQKEIAAAKVAYQNQVRQYGFLAGIAVLLLVAFLLFKNSRNRKKANDLLYLQKAEIEQQKEKVESTLSELKSTQSQLIQSEKMASLGELTAGIAHEIQNPLNFVNNFSDVNKELLFEMKDEMDKGNIADAKEIANDVIGNEEKINHHGKRADAIVKGMLQHSQSGKGVKEPTDINKLADEYLRLAYNGLRAKDKVFNATLKTDYDEGIGNINIVPQDIGRVLLNLYNNAFYTVKEKSSFQNLTSLYEPAVSVSTKKQGDKVLISVQDNGNGISQNIVDKIFQPFFTTKPTGQGTGLGLSLAYDIVKAHGGEFKVETKEKEGSEFIIQLPAV